MSPHFEADFATSDRGTSNASSVASFVATYDGSHGPNAPASPVQWAKIRPTLATALAPLDLSPRGTRRYATAYARLSAWALDQGLDLDTPTLLSAEVVEAFLSEQPVGTADLRSTLRRLAAAHGVGETPGALGYHKRIAQAPYSEQEESALISYARNLANQERRLGLEALLVLGLGCGLARGNLRGVGASSLHLHDDVAFVRTSGHCARVRGEFLELLEAICAARPTGELLGTRRRNITTEIVSWATGRVGVPTLRSDRLRASYICHWIEAGASVLDLLAWTGTKKLESLDPYLAHVPMPARDCSLPHEATGGAL